MLAALGVDDLSTAVYRGLLARPQATVDELGVCAGAAPDGVRTALSRLLVLGLVRRSGDEQGGWRAVHPVVGLAPLVARAEAEAAARTHAVEASKAHVAELSASFGGAPCGFGEDSAIVVGWEEAWDCLRQMAAQARCRVDVLAGAGLAPGLDSSGAEGFEPLWQLAAAGAERGVRIRIVALESVRANPALWDGTRWIASQGAEVRTTAAIPAWLFLVDRTYGLWALDPGEHRRGMVRFGAPGPMAIGSDLFDRHWREGRPVDVTPADAGDGPTPQQREILRLLAEGAKDETVARRFGVSTRTVRRMISDITARLGVESRFQLAVHAAERGWLDYGESRERHGTASLSS
ncbi:LuxR C-terminal-related transcriptional regulator [Streptomyces sp. NPDC058486]|uniref:helix-turn-helix transcriptional regulator n=1 Tax=unclassified Streptomyces TaxID=2593676 RepID=UPI00364C0878